MSEKVLRVVDSDGDRIVQFRIRDISDILVHESRYDQLRRRLSRAHYPCSSLAFALVRTFLVPWPSRVIRKLSFMPPHHCRYSFIKTPKGIRLGFRRSVLSGFPRNERGYMTIQEGTFDILFGKEAGSPKHWDCFYAKTPSNRKLACTLLKCPKPPSRLTILYSHSNAEDMGDTALMVSQWSRIFRHYNICIYDYTGYGLSKGKPSERSLYAGIRAVYDELRRRYNLSPTNIVVAGFSLGTAATVDLASKIPNLKGVVLLAPFLSAFRIVIPRLRHTCRLDQFASVDKMKDIAAPVLVAHGVYDSIVHFSHGRKLYKLARNKVTPLFMYDCGHNDIELDERTVDRFHAFLLYDLKTGSSRKVRRTMDPTADDLMSVDDISSASESEETSEHSCQSE